MAQIVSDLEFVLHRRLVARCASIYRDGHFREAAQLAMTCVELALKEKSGIKGPSAVRLINELLGSDEGIKLRVPFAEEMQSEAWKLFRGAFAYYRNYATHDGSKFDETTSFRVMILASELLDLIGASELSFTDTGGVDGLVRHGVFPDRSSIQALLSFLDGHTIIDDVFDGFYETLAYKGYGDEQVQALVDVGLVEYTSEPVTPSLEDLTHDSYSLDMIGHFELTLLGSEVLGDLSNPRVPPN